MAKKFQYHMLVDLPEWQKKTLQTIMDAAYAAINEAPEDDQRQLDVMAVMTNATALVAVALGFGAAEVAGEVLKAHRLHAKDAEEKVDA